VSPCLKASLVPISLNQTVGDEDQRTVEETLVDDHSEHPDDATGKVLLKEDLENVLNTLNPREVWSANHARHAPHHRIS